MFDSKTSLRKSESETMPGAEFTTPASTDSGVDPNTKHDVQKSIRHGESKALNCLRGVELSTLDKVFTTDPPRVMNSFPDAQYIALRHTEEQQDVALPDQLHQSLQPHETSKYFASEAIESAAEDSGGSMSSRLQSVPPLHLADVTPLAALYNRRDLKPYPALESLSIPNATIKVDMRQAELEAALLLYSEYDREIVKRIVGTHADGTFAVYSNHLQNYGRYAATKDQPTLPITPFTACRYFFARADLGKNFQQLVKEKDGLSACMRMLGIESCMADPLIARTMKAIALKIGRRHDGRATPFMTRDLRKSLPWLEKLARTDPDRALTYEALLVIGLATLLRCEEMVSIEVADFERTSYGYRLSVWKTKTKKAIEPPSYIHLQRIHDRRICPVRLIDEYLKRFGLTDGLFFRRISADGSPGESAMAPEKIAEIVGKVAEAASIGPRADFSGHSLRNGGINSAHEAGASLDEIRAVSLHGSRESTYSYINPLVSVRPLTAAIFS